MTERQAPEGTKLPVCTQTQKLTASNGEEATVEVYDNGTIATTEFARAAGAWGGGGGGGGRKCSGSCHGQTVTMSCPAGSSPVLDCTSGSPRLTCAKTLGGGVVFVSETLGPT